MVTQLVIDDGWIGAAIGPQRTVTAQGGTTKRVGRPIAFDGRFLPHAMKQGHGRGVEHGWQPARRSIRSAQPGSTSTPRR